MSTPLNPFVWDRPLDDPAKIVGMDGFANQVALTLKGQTNVALFGPRDTGKTTFTNQLALELRNKHGPEAPPFDVVKINLQRVVSLAGFIGCVHDAMASHPEKDIRRRAQRQVAALEKEIGFDIKVIKGTVRSRAQTPAESAENAPRAVNDAPGAIGPSRCDLRRIPAAQALSWRAARDHPFCTDELRRQPRVAPIHRVNPKCPPDDARELRRTNLRRGG